MNVNELNQKYGIDGTLAFETGNGELPVAKISNAFADATISLYGAHILSFTPKGQEDVLWMSQSSAYKVGTPIRGGIPVCFPWFGPHATDNQKPVHGFARLILWNVKETTTLADGSTKLALQLTDSDYTRNLWNFAFAATVTVIVGKALHITLAFSNTGAETFVCSDALHTYFNISGLENIGITGLQGTSFYVPNAEQTEAQTEETLLIQKEENRRYIEHTGDCVIADSGLNRKIKVGKTGSKVTVVWNPYVETAKNIGDIHEGGFNNFICVEAVNAINDTIQLSPGESWSISALIEII